MVDDGGMMLVAVKVIRVGIKLGTMHCHIISHNSGAVSLLVGLNPLNPASMDV